MRYVIVRPDGPYRVWNHKLQDWATDYDAAYDRDFSYGTKRRAMDAEALIVARSKHAAASDTSVRSFSFTELRVITREELFKEIGLEDWYGNR